MANLSSADSPAAPPQSRSVSGASRTDGVVETGGSPVPRRAAMAAILALFVATVLKCAWLSDDYFIGLRALDFLLAGEGMRYNPFERSNVYTTLLKLPFEIVASFITRDPFLIFASFAVIFNGLCLWLLWRLADRRPWRWCLAVVLLLISKAYIDFAWSGLENPMGYALVMGFVLAWLRLYPGLRGVDSPPDQTALRWLLAIATLAPLYRHDLTLLVWPATAWAWWNVNRRQGLARMALAAALVATPLAIYTLASLVYFGLPLPTSVYAKVGSSTSIDLVTGGGYYLFMLLHDPLTLALIVAATLGCLARGPARPLAVGLLLSLTYIAINSADYMGGRFFSTPYALVVALVVGCWPGWTGWLRRRLGAQLLRLTGAAALALTSIWLLAWPESPVAVSYDYKTKVLAASSGIANERASWHPHTRIGEWWQARRHGRVYPSHATTRIGKLIAGNGEDRDQIYYLCNAGLTPYYAGRHYTFIDNYGFADAFLARMPALTSRPAHKSRWRPKGYARTMATGRNHIVDPKLAEYYDIVRLVTAAEELFTWERLATIVRFNLGAYSHLLTQDLAKLPAPEPFPTAKFESKELIAMDNFVTWKFASWIYPRGCAYKVQAQSPKYLRRILP